MKKKITYKRVANNFIQVFLNKIQIGVIRAGHNYQAYIIKAENDLQLLTPQMTFDLSVKELVIEFEKLMTQRSADDGSTALEQKLTKETENFKNDYLIKTKAWAESQLVRNIERQNKFYNSCKADYSNVREYYKEQKFVYNSPTYYFREEFVPRSVKKAREHYEESIKKLVARIMTKQLNIESIKTSTAYLDPNLSITITDGEKTVRAFTIIASGPVQRPHYRYLVK